MVSQQGELALGPTFGRGFLDHHAGRIITDLHFAVVELVANAWDAGADEVQITWPEQDGGTVAIADNGSGMTQDEFVRRWRELTYNRLDNQGRLAEFPPKKTSRRRVAFGRNGLGRHAMFFFADTYEVTTSKAGTASKFAVTRSSGETPFKIQLISSKKTRDTGTLLQANTIKRLPASEEIVELIGSRFVADPQFRIFVNKREVTLTDLERLIGVGELAVAGVGTFKISRFDAQLAGRTSKQSGVAWWVNGRLVGEPSWDVFDGPLLDARGRTAKRFVYIVEANVLGELKRVKPDWSGFYGSPETNAAKQAVSEYIRNDLRTVTEDVRRDRKVSALRANKPQIERLPVTSQEHVAKFTDEMLVRAPTITPRDLDSAVKLLANLEESRSGYRLIRRLAQLRPDDLDALDAILADWSVQDAKRVLDELHFRLKLIVQLESLVDKHTTDELHDLQPLFERGLWIFGPMFEAISFTSNRTLATVVRELFGETVITKPKFRPDFVVLPESSIGVYSTESFDQNHEVSGLESVVIVELKRGGSHITTTEKDQGLGYTRHLRKLGRVGTNTKITVYVLGTTVDTLAEPVSVEGNTEVHPKRYSDVLKQAHARTFKLMEKIKEIKGMNEADPDLTEALNLDIPVLDLDDESAA